MCGQHKCLIQSLRLLLFSNPKVMSGFLQERLWQEIFKCHQHKGCESVKPALGAGGQEGWDPKPGERGRVC